MYYLRKEPCMEIIPQIEKTDGTVLPERSFMSYERAVYKHNQFSRFYRKEFVGIDGAHEGMRLYMCKRLKTILKARKRLYEYCGEYFDVYDENGIVDIECVG